MSTGILTHHTLRDPVDPDVENIFITVCFLRPSFFKIFWRLINKIKKISQSGLQRVWDTSRLTSWMKSSRSFLMKKKRRKKKNRIMKELMKTLRKLKKKKRKRKRKVLRKQFKKSNPQKIKPPVCQKLMNLWQRLLSTAATHSINTFSIFKISQYF